jgi:hypothetical protein
MWAGSAGADPRMTAAALRVREPRAVRAQYCGLIYTDSHARACRAGISDLYTDSSDGYSIDRFEVIGV